MGKQKAGIIAGIVFFLLGIAYISSDNLKNLTSNMLANGECSQSFLTNNKDSYIQNKNRFDVVQRQTNEIQTMVTSLQGRITSENRKINGYTQEIQSIKKKILKEDDAKVIENLRDDIQHRQDSIKSSETKIRGYAENIGKYKTDISNLRNTVRTEQKIVTTYETCQKNLSKWPSITTNIMSGEVYMPLMSGENTVFGETMMPEEGGIITGNAQTITQEMNLYTLSVESPQKDIKINSLKFKTTFSKTGQSVDGKIYDSWFLRSNSDNSVCTCTNSSQEYGVYVVECAMDSCRANIKKKTGETYTLLSRDWAIAGTGFMTTRFIDMSYDDDKGGINNLSVPKKLTFSATSNNNSGGENVDICTIAPDICAGNHWVLLPWSSCQNGGQSQGADCQDANGNKIQDSNCSQPKPLNIRICNGSIAQQFTPISAANMLASKGLIADNSANPSAWGLELKFSLFESTFLANKIRDKNFNINASCRNIFPTISGTICAVMEFAHDNGIIRNTVTTVNPVEVTSRLKALDLALRASCINPDSSSETTTVDQKVASLATIVGLVGDPNGNYNVNATRGDVFRYFAGAMDYAEKNPHLLDYTMPGCGSKKTNNTSELSNFIVTAPIEVYTNEAFNVTVKATKSDNTKLSSYLGTVYFDVVNSSPENIILPSFGDNGYKFTTVDQGEHTFSKSFTIKKPGTYIIETYEIESNANNGDGVSKQITIVAKDRSSGTTPTFTGFKLSLPSTTSVNTPINLSVTAIKNDNNADTSYNKSVIILIDGDPQATFPLTTQKLSNGILDLPRSITFKSIGTKTVIVKDIETGIETKKTITVTANEEENENDNNLVSTPISTALLDNTTGLSYEKEINFMKLDIRANDNSDILLKTIPLNIRIYTKKLNIGNLKLRDSEGKILDVSMSAVNKMNEFDKDVQLEIKFNTPYALSAGSGKSFILTGIVTGETNPYDAIVTWLGDKKKFTGVIVALQKPFTGEDISGYSWNAITLMRR